jgi:FkbM family methyltransferase
VPANIVGEKEKEYALFGSDGINCVASRCSISGVGSSIKHQVISWVSKNLFDHVTYTVRNGLNQGLKRRGGLGWIPMEATNTPEHKFWKALDLRGKVVYDIGAFHGLLTLYFARQAKKVVAWEPNSHNRQRLNENLKLNAFSNVTVRPYGLSSHAMQAEMSFDPLAPGTASIDSGMARGKEHETIELRTLDEEQGLESPDLIKVDVEGFELEVLKGAVRTLASNPTLFLEMHGADPADKRARVKAIVNHLWAAGYRNIFHVESETQITPDNTDIAAQGHLYVLKS